MTTTLDKPSDQLPPHDDDAEKAVLGCILCASCHYPKPPTPHELIDDFQALFKTDTNVFYSKKNRTLFEVMSEMRDDRENIDTITLQARLHKKNLLEACGGTYEIITLPDLVPCASNLPHYLNIIMEKYKSRLVMAACSNAIQNAYVDSAGNVASDVENELSKVEFGANDLILNAKEAADATIDDLEYRFQLQGKRSGLTTGLTRLDNLTDGLQFGEQTILAARPSIGKTAMALNFVERICLVDQIPTLFCTLEMSPPSLCKRLLSSSTRIKMGLIRQGTFSEDDFRSFNTFNLSLRRSPLYFINGIGGIDAVQLSAQIRRMVRKFRIRFVVIDYLQKIQPTTRQEKRTYEIGHISGMIRALAVETKAAFLTLAQLNRESEKEKGRAPRLSDLADSGQIERDADTVALLHRKRDDTTGESKLIIAKQRDGEVGIVDLSFNGKYCRFENVIYTQEQT